MNDSQDQNREPNSPPDPASRFGSPEALLADAGLSNGEKRRLLERWRFEAEALETATDEGMSGGESNLLTRVNRALAALPSSEREAD